MTDTDNREVLEYDGSTGAVLRWYAFGMGLNDVLNQMNVPAGRGRRPCRISEARLTGDYLLTVNDLAVGSLGLPHGRKRVASAALAARS